MRWQSAYELSKLIDFEVINMVSAPNLYQQSHTRSMTTHRRNINLQPQVLKLEVVYPVWLTALFSALTCLVYTAMY